MDKQEMVRCPLNGSCYMFERVEVCCHQTPHLRENVCREKPTRGCPGCVPVEPAQPELPMELPQIEMRPHGDDTFFCGAYTQQEADQKIYDLALKRIAELESQVKIGDEGLTEAWMLGAYEGRKKAEVEIASLKEQLADLRAINEQHRILNGQLRESLQGEIDARQNNHQ